MKLALFSDIHANYEALSAVLKDIDTKQPDAIYCLGDLVGYAPFPNEVIETIRLRGIPVIAGNYDQGIGLGSKDCGCAYKTEKDKSQGAVSISFTNNTIKDENRAYLRSLPAHMRIEFGVNNDIWNLLLVHGSPRKINEYLFEDRADKSLLRMMQKADTHLMAFGHTHKPYHKKLKDDDGRIRHAINIGSVGKPKDGDSRACYVMLEWDGELNLTKKNSLSVSFIRVPYNIETSAGAIEESTLPNDYAEMLRKAY